jgi:phospholipase C
VVTYEENHSFDNLYGRWGPVNGDTINGVGQADLDHTVQVSQTGTPFTCLKQLDVNLTTPPLSPQ